MAARVRSVGMALILLVVAAAMSGCTVTRFRADVQGNPLATVAEHASEEDQYAVEWEGEDTLKLRDTWPVHSVFTLGWTTFNAELHYADAELTGSFYWWNSSLLGCLFIPMYLDTGPGFAGAALKPYMRRQRKEILGWAGLQESDVEFTHGSSP